MHNATPPPVSEIHNASVASLSASKNTIIAGVTSSLLLSCIVGGAILYYRVQSQGNKGQPTANGVQADPVAKQPLATTPKRNQDSRDAIWARPKPGQPIRLQYLPNGTPAIIRIRLAALAAHAEGPKIVRSLGPIMQDRYQQLLDSIGIEASAVDSLTIALLPDGGTMPRVVLVGEITEPQIRDQMVTSLRVDQDGQAVIGANTIWFPNGPPTFVMGPANDLREIRSQAAEPRLNRELRELQGQSHDTDHLVILANPHFFRDEAPAILPGPPGLLLAGCYRLWTDDAMAINLSLQLSDVVVAELRMAARAETLPRKLAATLDSQLRKLPTDVSDHLAGLALDPYWQRLAMRFPSMVQFIAEQTRVVTDGRQVVVSSAAPVEALHNVLLASELTLSSVPISTSDRPTDTLRSIEELLAQRISVSFAQQSLGDAVVVIQDEVRAGLNQELSIQIVGQDLQREGITQNQQIRNFVVQNQPLTDILTQLVSKANPAADVTELSNPSQKLVWVQQGSQVLITTRQAAARKGYTLPAAFQK